VLWWGEFLGLHHVLDPLQVCVFLKVFFQDVRKSMKKQSSRHVNFLMYNNLRLIRVVHDTFSAATLRVANTHLLITECTGMRHHGRVSHGELVQP